MAGFETASRQGKETLPRRSSGIYCSRKNSNLCSPRLRGRCGRRFPVPWLMMLIQCRREGGEASALRLKLPLRLPKLNEVAANGPSSLILWAPRHVARNTHMAQPNHIPQALPAETSIWDLEPGRVSSLQGERSQQGAGLLKPSNAHLLTTRKLKSARLQAQSQAHWEMNAYLTLVQPGLPKFQQVAHNRCGPQLSNSAGSEAHMPVARNTNMAQPNLSLQRQTT